MSKEIKVHGRLTAIQYLVDNSQYNDEWSGAGMYEAVHEVMNHPDTTFTKAYLDGLLNKARDF